VTLVLESATAGVPAEVMQEAGFTSTTVIASLVCAARSKATT